MSPDSEIIDFYAMIRDYWRDLTAFRSTGPTVMLNFGYWATGATDLHLAQQAFVDLIVHHLPAPLRSGHGLEIGCGIGGISIGVLQRLPLAHLAGVDISQQQLALASRNAAQAGLAGRFRPTPGNSMDLPLPDEAFDFTLCIESSFHYPDKPRFLQENFRVLKPGGTAIIADITCTHPEHVRFRQGNHFESPGFYREHIVRTGFALQHEQDIGPQVYSPLYRHVLAFNTQHRSAVSKYWSMVLSNYDKLQQAGEMGYHLFVMSKPPATAPAA